jgi:hypothetical protein
MLARKGLFIVLLISLIAGYFYFRPFLNGVQEEPEIVDRLPVGDFIGKMYVLDIARETNSFLYYNKLPFRDFLTYEFILAQGKSYGLDLQKPVYFFANENGEWGSLVTLNDSSKIISGMNRIKQELVLSDTLVGGQKVKKIPNENIYMTYGKYWMFIYHGKQLPKRMYHVIYSKKNDVHPLWKDFLAQKQFSNESVSVYSNWKKIKEFGVKNALLSFDCDSINFHIKSYVKGKEEYNIAVKDSGLALVRNATTDRFLSMHFNVSKLRNNPNDPLVKLAAKLGKRISFPIYDFLRAWEGDLTLQEGGQQTIKETYIETEFDDDFNATEVKKEKEVTIMGYSVLLSMNSFQKEFISKLFAKGIMRKENNRFYILTSPPLKINQKPNFLLLHSSEHAPKLGISKENKASWVHEKTKFNFQLDSLNSNELFFSFHFPGVALFKKNIFKTLRNPF